MKRLIPVLFLTILAGCFGVSTERVLDKDGKGVGVSHATTGLPPRATVDRAVVVMKRLQLQPVGGGGLFGSSKEWPVRSDHFSATVKANTAAGDAVEVVATWVDEGKTDLQIRSTLNDAQHKHLVSEIMAAMK